MKNKLFIISILSIAAASILFTGCKKKEEKLDLSSKHTSAAVETQATQKENKEIVANEKSDFKIEDTNKQEKKEEKNPIALKDEKYNSDSANIKYPQIEELSGNADKDKINSLIKNNALSVIEAMNIDTKKDSLSLDYKIISSTPKRLSIAYNGKLKKDNKESNIFYTNTIDLNTLKNISLSDYADAYTMAGYILSDDIKLDGNDSPINKEFMEKRKEKSIDEYTKILQDSDFPLKKGTDGKIIGFSESFSYEKNGNIYFTIPFESAHGNYVTVVYSPSTK